MEPVDRREFEALVADALDTLPPDLTGLMDNVVVLTADRGDPRTYSASTTVSPSPNARTTAG
ncbi:MAG: hypothetical protein Ct9H300mP31_14830 [Acidimicrobiaceae bacterium]|nr:MAG: hypothetical protein Ct9H300mP31_14830 [Acidimicrobiaceae bacterium]